MRVIICDDNASERAHFRKIMEEVAAEEEIDVDILEFEDAKPLIFEMEDFIATTDVILLDIHMPGMNGMAAADKLRKNKYKGEILFVTVSKNYMLNAFDVHAFNYIVKGETQAEKSKEVIRELFEAADEKRKEYILFTGVGEYRNIPISSIRYFEVNGKILTVHYGSKTFEFVSTIGKVENVLYGKGFVRVHRSYLVSIAAVKSFVYESLTLVDGTIIPIGRKHYKELKEEMTKRVII